MIYKNGFWSTRTISLPDGSTLRLAPDTRLIYPSSFKDGVRKVLHQKSSRSGLLGF